MIHFKVNGLARSFDGDPEMPLLWYLRDILGTHRHKIRLWHGLVRRMHRAAERKGYPLLHETDEYGAGSRDHDHRRRSRATAPHAVQKAWAEVNVPQCGYCQPGQIMQAVSLLSSKPHPTDDDIDAVMAGNICRCGTYQRIRAAIKTGGEGDGMIIEITIENVSRRGFLQGMLSAGAFVLCARMVPRPLWAETSSVASVDASAFHPGIFVGIQTDGTVYIVAHRSEMGNGVRTSLPRILADELDADWSRVRVIQGDGDERYGSQDTDGSHSVREFFDVMREAGATARLMLVRAAAQQWGVPESQCVADPVHTVSDKNSNRKLGYGELAALAAKLPVPKKEELKMKSPQPGATSASPRPGSTFQKSVRASRFSAWTCASTACSTRPSRTRRCSEGK